MNVAVMARLSFAARRALPYFATAGCVIETDRVIDVQMFAWPALAAVIICGAVAWLAKRRPV